MLRKNLSTEHTEGTDRWEFLVASLEILEEIFIQVSQLRELIEVKEVITSYGRSGS